MEVRYWTADSDMEDDSAKQMLYDSTLEDSEHHTLSTDLNDSNWKNWHSGAPQTENECKLAAEYNGM